jgi:hypothetical protein
VGFGKDIVKQKLSANASFSVLFNTVNGASSGNVKTLNGGLTYAVSKQHRFQFNTNVINNNGTFAGNPDFTEVRVDAGYTYSFNTAKSQRP